jgi:AraC-like DNA-binding protein
MDEPPWPSCHTKPGYAYTGFEFDVTKVKCHPGLAVRWAGRELFNMDCLVEATSYPFALIKYTIAGRSVLCSETAKWTIEPGMALWIGAKTSWRHLPDEESKPVSYVVMLVGDELPELFQKNFGSAVGCTPLAHPYRVESLMEEIMREGRLRSARFEDNCLCLAQVLVDRIAADMARGAKPLNVARATYERCYDYIAANYSSIAGLGQIADSCHISVPYLCRLFEQFGETSPYDFLTRQRLQKAEMLLVGGTMSISRIAAVVGYNSPGHFTRAFRTQYGVSPSEFRDKGQLQ